jgi:hypothetical protein
MSFGNRFSSFCLSVILLEILPSEYIFSKCLIDHKVSVILFIVGKCSFLFERCLFVKGPCSCFKYSILSY